MSSDKKAANAVGGKTARACDSCMCKRARWYCAADDAFLCQACDASVHSANSLARRHERVRLKTASLKPTKDVLVENSPPAWHHGFRRKARTPRHGKHMLVQSSKALEPMLNPLPLVPEIGNDEISPDENEEQLLYRVPIFDPFAELCSNETMPSDEAITNVATTGLESKVQLSANGHDATIEFENLHGLLPSDMDLAEFAADVETLLGRGLEEDSFDMEGLGLLGTKEEDNREYYFENGRVKVEKEEEGEMEAVVSCHVDPDLDMPRETLDLNFDYDTGDMEQEKVAVGAEISMISRRISLRLDYDAVIAAWACQGSPWTTGDRPQINPDDCWPDCLGTCPTDVHPSYGDLGGTGGHLVMGDGGREARVSRYREKRRTRLFSKKIRYEVRKLNAEKRPRMKGRFVKRTSFVGVGPTFPF